MKRIAWKMDRGAPSREMARAEGYVMARRKGCAPYIVPARVWDALPEADAALKEASDERAQEDGR